MARAPAETLSLSSSPEVYMTAFHQVAGRGGGVYQPLPSSSSSLASHSSSSPSGSTSPPPRYHLPRARLVTLLSLGSILLLLLLQRQGSLQWIITAGSKEEGDWIQHATWAQLFNASSRDAGWRGFTAAAAAAAPSSLTTIYRPTLSKDGWFHHECLESWARGGGVSGCPLTVKEGEEGKVDVLWTWTNGSDPLLRRWRMDLLASSAEKGVTSPPRHQLQRRAQGGLKGRVQPETLWARERRLQRHFREHDELRYSLRSVLQAFLPSSLGNLTLLTTDLPFDSLGRVNSSSSSSEERVGQVPHWLKKDQEQEGLQVKHHTEVFGDRTHTPSFNSLAIESQFAQLLDSSTTTGADFILYMNDDTFLLGSETFSFADVGSSLYGPVFRLQRDFTVDAKSPEEPAGDEEGEWPGLRRANWLLNRRFGIRHRAYLAHLSKTISPPLLHEMAQLWSEELASTASSRFRGRKTEYTTLFLASHYIIESHRQALLYSYFLLRADTNLDGSLSLAERRVLLADLGFPDQEQEESLARQPRRDTLHRLGRQLEALGLERPRSTKIVFDSRDGFGLFTAQGSFREGPPPGSRYSVPSSWPVLPLSAAGEGRYMCSFKRTECLGGDFLQPSSARIATADLFRRIAFERPECGDCAILLLMTKSGPTGIEAFLPPPPSSSSSSSSDPPPPPPSSPPFQPLGGSTVKDHPSLDLSLDPLPSSPAEARQRALRLIRRYSYAIGDTESRFIAMKLPHLVDRDLKALREDVSEGDLEGEGAGPRLLTLNDDMQTEISAKLVGERLKIWFAEQWPNPSPFERAE